MPVVLKVRGYPFEDAAALDEYMLVRVDQDVADGRIAQQRFQRPESKHIVEQLGEERFALGETDRHPLFAEQLAEERADFSFSARAIRLCERLEVQTREELAVHVGPELQVLLSGRLRARL